MIAIPSFGPLRRMRTTYCAVAAASMLVVMLLAQLYGYEEFSEVLSASLTSTDGASIQVIAAVLVCVELLALPYLLAMYLSPLFRMLSAGLACAASGFWLLVSLTSAHVSNVGFFSDVLAVPGGLLALGWSLVLVCLVIYVVSADYRVS